MKALVTVITAGSLNARCGVKWLIINIVRRSPLQYVICIMGSFRYNGTCSNPITFSNFILQLRSTCSDAVIEEQIELGSQAEMLIHFTKTVGIHI